MPKPTAPKSEPARASNLQRIRVDADGYDDAGAYWGAGPDVYIAMSADGAEEITVRAASRRDARAKVEAERNRKPGAPPATRVPLGGTSPNKSRYEVDWHAEAGGPPIRIRITHARDYPSIGSDHIEVESIKPKGAPLPITATGYRSHFIKALDLVNEGGPVTFVTAWLEREAKGAVWRKAQSQRAQGDLFHWAAAQAETTQRRPSPQRHPKQPIAKPRARTSRKDKIP